MSQHRFPDFFDPSSDSEHLKFDQTKSNLSNPKVPKTKLPRKQNSAPFDPNSASKWTSSKLSDNENVPEDTLCVIREAANRQWRRLQETGVETNKLLELATTILHSIDTDSPKSHDLECYGLELGSAGDLEPAEPWSDETGLDQPWSESVRLPENQPQENQPQENQPQCESSNDLSGIDWADQDTESPVSVGGTINLRPGSKEPVIVSLEGFFKFSFEFSEALNDLVEEARES